MAGLKKNTASKNINAKLSALRSDIDALKNDAKNIVADGEDIAHDRAQAAIQTAENVAERAYRLAEETAVDWAGDVETWTNDNLDSARESVRRQPFTAIFLSLGAGMLLSAFFRRH